METRTISDLATGAVLVFEMQGDTAQSLRVTAVDGTTVEVILSPGAEARITKGTGLLRVRLNQSDVDFPGPGLTLLQPLPTGN